MRKKTGQQPEIGELKAELNRERYKYRYVNVLKSTIYTLVVVAAFAILVATLWMPVLQIYGSSMTPTLTEGQIVLSLKSSEFNQGDLIAFYIGNKVLVKRVIAKPAELVSINDEGVVRVNSVDLEEPYVSNRALGECDLEFPYQVPEARYFVMGDHRETSIDSRSNAVGCISDEQIVGKIVFCLWPLADFGPLNREQGLNDVQ